MSIEWKTLPKSHRQQRFAEIDEDVTVLKTRPGQWARIRTDTVDAAQTPYKNRGCEVTSRASGKDAIGRQVFDVYARWPEAHA